MKLFEFGQVVQELSFNKISNLELWRPLSIAEQIHFCNFDREHYEEQVYQVILNSDQWFRRIYCLKIFLT